MYSFHASANLTITELKDQLHGLKQHQLEQFKHQSVYKLIAENTAFYDAMLQHLWQQFGLDQDNELSLIAVGGYGRTELFPLSDLDLLILYTNKITSDISDKISLLLQFLWDCKLKVAQSVRTVSECITEAKADISTATNLLEARFLIGNDSSYSKLQQAIQNPSFWPEKQFFDAKIAEQKLRYQQYNSTGYNLEPDIKNNPGGLRDLHLLYWINLRRVGYKNLDEMLAAKFILAEEYTELHKCQTYLYRMRFALHLVVKRYDNRMLFDYKLKVSKLMGFEAEDNSGVEAMMRIFYQTVKKVKAYTQMLVQYYAENTLDIKHEDNLIDIDQNFQLDNNAIKLTYANAFSQQPEIILDLFFYLTKYPNATIHSTTLRQLQLALANQTNYLVNNPKARDKFLRIFSQPDAISLAIVPMHQYGVLSAYMPEWQAIEGLSQFDLFHTYTVDEHMVRTMLKIESFGYPSSKAMHPLCTTIFPTMENKPLLYLTALLHDIGKGTGRDHSEAGAEIVIKFAALHNFSQHDTELMRWLVANHLIMSTTAQRRDIYNPSVVAKFAEQVKYKQYLDNLVCLTVADICGTNQSLWNDWKRSLIFTLYNSTLRYLEQDAAQVQDPQAEISQHKNTALEILSQNIIEDPKLAEQINQFWQRCPDSYFIRNNPAQLAWHAYAVCMATNPIIVLVNNNYIPGVTEVFVYCGNEKGIFYRMVDIMERKNLSIHNAHIITTNDDYALDSFVITELNGSALTPERMMKIQQEIHASLSRKKEANTPKSYSTKIPARHFKVPTRIRFVNNDEPLYTEIEFKSLDMPGLLACISEVFYRLNINLLNAKIMTNGEKAENFFMIVNEQGVALNQEEKEYLKQQLLSSITEHIANIN